MTDTYRAMCEELVEALAEWRLGGGPPEDTADADLIERARALLAQPVAQPPADGEVAELVKRLYGGSSDMSSQMWWDLMASSPPAQRDHLNDITRAAWLLERYALPTPEATNG